MYVKKYSSRLRGNARKLLETGQNAKLLAHAKTRALRSIHAAEHSASSCGSINRGASIELTCNLRLLQPGLGQSMLEQKWRKGFQATARLELFRGLENRAESDDVRELY
jgi:hypothetical protein